ncbi:hypothetical protein HB364_29635 [Pseudoflavitalea sp. X16]|uniref:AbiJ-NTD4 domain-containing protein n=1 Tax=Paraflavitalea devenefica TaxID=2716334 RepID=UPI00141DD7AF|nr:hypothetical protein [Paraflavitalea devenefica]NII29278.1 hypothetical protein [Paraflavitalea devenefica]
MNNNSTIAMNFSQRIGLAEVKHPFQVDTMSETLRTRLWNALYGNFLVRLHHLSGWSDKKRILLITSIWGDFFMQTVDKLVWKYNGIDPDSFEECMKERFYKADYNRVFDFIEFTIFLLDQADAKAVDPFINACNQALEKEGSVYRVVNRIVIRVTNDTELKEIAQAAATEAEDQIGSHFSRAMELMANRNDPDYNQAVLEAIMAVEETLRQYPDKIIQDMLSPVAVYGNVMINVKQVLSGSGPTLTFEEAKYWLLTCATLLNYLKTIAS